MERTLILAKPDAVQRGLVGELIGRLERRGLRIAGLKFMRVSRATAEEHYKEHSAKPFFAGLVEYITACPIVALAMEGPNAVDIARATIGATNPANATPGSIRGDLAVSIGRNLIHGSDSLASAKRELDLFFGIDELFDYQRSAEPWIFES
ncbi:MAG: nucleoside-diphosphate kinase [Candidatus Eremiobacter antarcticus]|nr:nucleoside-diphosphate kinase [Candidatus Eremiobacteraeota bacterium]MBC5808023.1 nucleoside-diphosphate kinase [Candidatus Eremiobacteraeota bacterium]PZR63431.1 MAG: nucleoside-diphosphate kinase [Candidatus Eremiobacter sp. RRmetagenome_bin22]